MGPSVAPTGTTAVPIPGVSAPFIDFNARPTRLSFGDKFRQLTQAFVDRPQFTFAGLRGGQELVRILAERERIEDRDRFISAKAEGAKAELSVFDRQNAARQRELNEKSRLSSFQRQRQGLRERGAIRARAAETGALGATPLRQLSQSLFDEGFDLGTIGANREGRIAQSLAERDSASSRTETTLGGLRVQAQANRPTNPFIAGLRITAAGLVGAAEGEKIRQTRRQFRDI